MARHVVRFRHGPEIRWGVVASEQVFMIGGSYETLSDFLLKGGREKAASGAFEGPSLALKDLELLSPVTSPCNVLCQGLNYEGHVRETGADPRERNFNLLFSKASSSIAPAHGRLVRPGEVRLLDYELELGLVIGRKVEKRQNITPEQLGDMLCGIVMANDVSARDVQITEEQWFRAKSFRGFTPVGPYLCLLDPHEWAFVDDLELRLWVNGELRQKANTRELIFKPAETLEKLTGVMNLEAGDLILTGTPAGVALQSPPPWKRRLAEALLSRSRRTAIFLKGQLSNPRYLKPGDLVEAKILSEKHGIDLGRQKLQIA